MTVFVWDEVSQEEVRVVRKYAEENPILFKKLMSGFIAGDDGLYTCYMNGGDYRCVFTIEQQIVTNKQTGNKDTLWIRHLSVSIKKGGRLPLPQAVEVIMDAFGFNGGLANAAQTWLEPEDEPEAINVLGLIEDEDLIRKLESVEKTD